MIEVEKINGEKININIDIIETIESTPDTHICTTTGKRFIVKESIKEIVELIIDFKKQTTKSITIIKEVVSTEDIKEKNE